MAAIDYQTVLAAAVESALKDSPLINRLPIGNFLGKANPKQAAKLRQARAPADYPQITISTIARPEQQHHTSTPTFGLGRVTGCDAIMPIQHALSVTYEFLVEQWLKNHPGAVLLHIEGRRALNKQYPRMGFNWVRGFTVTESAKPPPDRGARMIVEDLVNFDLRLHLAQVANA